MTSKSKIRLKWIPSILISVFITSSAIMKIAGAPALAALYGRMGFEHQMPLFGIAELAFISLFLYQPTARIGFFLLTAYYGGAMAVELLLGNFFVLPASILMIIWVAAYLRDSSLFKQSNFRVSAIARQRLQHTT